MRCFDKSSSVVVGVAVTVVSATLDKEVHGQPRRIGGAARRVDVEEETVLGG